VTVPGVRRARCRGHHLFPAALATLCLAATALTVGPAAAQDEDPLRIDLHSHPSRFHRANVPRISDEEIARYLVERGKLVRLPSGLLLAASALERSQAALLATGWDTFTAADFNDPFCLTLPCAIPPLAPLTPHPPPRPPAPRP